MFVNVLMLIKLELVASLYNINKYTQKKKNVCIGDGIKWTLHKTAS